MSERPELPAGTVLGAYGIVRCIAVGGMGAVYEAEHLELRKRVALKTPHSEAGLSPEGRARFVQEGKTASKIRHPHVVDITDVGEVGDTAYLVMEYLEGEPLSTRIVREGPLPAAVIADILVPVAAALHEAHGLGIIHRDLKPDNIFLTQSVHGTVHPKILDFGISKVLGDERSPKLTSASRVMLGTPDYVSPEQLHAPHAITAKSDQYSLGVVIYEAATGCNPFSGQASLMSVLWAIEHGNYPRPRELNGAIDERLERVALQAMSVAPDARFPSMAALGAALLPLASRETQNAWGRYFSGEPATHTAPTPLVRKPRAARPRTLWAGTAALLVSVSAAALLVVGPNLDGAPPEVRASQAAPTGLHLPGDSRRALRPSEVVSTDAAPAPSTSTAPSAVARATPPEAAAVPEAAPARDDTPKPATKPRPSNGKFRPPQPYERSASAAAPIPRAPTAPAPAAEPPATRPAESLQTDNVDPWNP